jgi:hypothetical protein
MYETKCTHPNAEDCYYGDHGDACLDCKWRGDLEDLFAKWEDVMGDEEWNTKI